MHNKIKIKNEDKNNDRNPIIFNDYKLFNPYYQKERLKEIFEEFKKKALLNEEQYQCIVNKIDNLNNLDLNKFRKKMRIPRYITFEEKIENSLLIIGNPTKEVTNNEKKKLYYLLIKLDFLSYEKINVTPRNRI